MSLKQCRELAAQRNVTLHLGFSKTATTTLQDMFCRHGQAVTLAKPYESIAHQTMILDIAWKDSLFYDPTELTEFLIPRLQAAEGKAVVVSEEAFLGDEQELVDRGVVLQRLQSLFHPCKVLICLRSQPGMICSYYMKHASRPNNAVGHRGRPVRFGDWFEFQKTMPHERSFFASKRYYRVLKMVCALFGPENVKIMLFEDFLNNRSEFLKDLCSYVGVDHEDAGRILAGLHRNKGIRLSPFHIYGLKGTKEFLGGTFRTKVRLSSTQREYLDEYYGRDNRLLQREFGLDLEGNGYPMASGA